MKHKYFILSLLTFLLFFSKGLAAQSVGLGLSPFGLFNAAVLHNSLESEKYGMSKKDFNTQYSGRYLLGLPLELTWSKDDGTRGSLRSGVALTPANNMASFFLGFQTFLSIPLDEDKEKATVGKFLIGTGLDLFVGGTEK